MLQSDFSSYLSHSALLINTIAIITSSGRFSIHYTSFISVPHTLHLNYYYMQSQYKSVIQFVQQYKNLYAKFEASLRRNEGLIRNSVLFKSWKFPIVLVHVVCLHLTAARVPKHYIIYIILSTTKKPPPHSASYSSASTVSAPVGGRKNTTSASYNG